MSTRCVTAMRVCCRPNRHYTGVPPRLANIWNTVDMKRSFSTTTALWDSTSHPPNNTQSKGHSKFLDQVEESVQRVLNQYPEHCASDPRTILNLPPSQRESLGVARNLHTRLTAFSRNGDCRRCWLQQAHCVCGSCPPLEGQPHLANKPLANVRRLFLLTHHKEICLAVDTAKLILAAFPETCRLVVAGIGPEFQPSMKEMMDAMKPCNIETSERKCLVLFPTDSAITFEQLDSAFLHAKQTVNCDSTQLLAQNIDNVGWDVIVLDGTWAQARKLHQRYITPEADGGPPRVRLSDEAVAVLSAVIAGEDESLTRVISPGHQLRRHPIKWREVSTLEATRLLLGDMMSPIKRSMSKVDTHDSRTSSRPWDMLALYQQTADKAALTQLGPPRRSTTELDVDTNYSPRSKANID